MKVFYHRVPSRHLAQDFEIKVFGDRGKPVMAFPSCCGRFFDYENFGMVDTLAPFIEAGEICLVCVDSRDSNTWFSPQKTADMGIAHHQYELCITEEVPKFLKQEYGLNECFLATGCSWGAYHAANFALKFPEVFDVSVALSGAYTLSHAIGNYYDISVYFNDILMYLPNLNNENILQELRFNYFVICHSVGPWEQCNPEARAVAELLEARHIPCWYDVWGGSYPHDWPSWKEQITKFMGAFSEGVIHPKQKDPMRLIGPNRRIQKL